MQAEISKREQDLLSAQVLYIILLYTYIILINIFKNIIGYDSSFGGSIE